MGVEASRAQVFVGGGEARDAVGGAVLFGFALGAPHVTDRQMEPDPPAAYKRQVFTNPCIDEPEISFENRDDRRT